MKGLGFITIICFIVTAIVFSTQNRTTEYTPRTYNQYYNLPKPSGLIYLEEDSIMSNY